MLSRLTKHRHAERARARHRFNAGGADTSISGDEADSITLLAECVSVSKHFPFIEVWGLLYRPVSPGATSIRVRVGESERSGEGSSAVATAALFPGNRDVDPRRGQPSVGCCVTRMLMQQ